MGLKETDIDGYIITTNLPVIKNKRLSQQVAVWDQGTEELICEFFIPVSDFIDKTHKEIVNVVLEEINKTK